MRIRKCVGKKIISASAVYNYFLREQEESLIDAGIRVNMFALVQESYSIIFESFKCLHLWSF